MERSREDRISELQQALAVIPRADWPSFLESASDGDRGLCEEVLQRQNQLTHGTTIVRSTPEQSGYLSAAASDQQAFGRFSPGAVLLDRFRIVRLLGTGGMGEVYEAEDLELREQVALKTIKLTHGDDTRMMDRLRKEVQLGRRVTHPSVCRLFDVFRVVVASGTGGSGVCAVITMQLLRGRTLQARLKADGPVALADALPIALQIAEGLHAAHDAGIVHRDLKTANVFLIEETGSPRAVITDFGLATTLPGVPTGDWPELSQPGAVVGTLAYMSPEQLRGEPATPASDLYAFGVVLYEMVSGQLPFRAGTPLAAAWKRLTEPPEDVTQHVPELPEAWRATIHRCLAAQPEDRFVSAGEAVAALIAPGHSRWRHTVQFVAAVAAIVLIWLGSAFVGAGWRDPATSTAASQPAPARPSVALFGFRNVSAQDDVAYISTALDQGLGSELAADGLLRMISGEEVARVKRELSLAATDTLASDTLQKVRQILQADYIVLGSYTALGSRGRGELRVDVRLQDTRSGGILAAWSHTGNESELFTLITDSGSSVRSRLGLDQLVEAGRFVHQAERRSPIGASADAGANAPASAPAGRRGLSAALPASQAGRRLYANGLDALRAFDARAARDLFERTTALEPDFAFARVGMSMAWAQLGYDTPAVREAAAAAELARGMRDEQRLWIEGHYREVARDWPRAITAFRQLVEEYPDEPEYVLRLADAQTSAGMPRDALATIGAAGKALPAVRTDPRFLIAQASAAEALGDVVAQERSARAAIVEGERRGERLLVARASIALGDALRVRGDLDGARRAGGAARTLYEQTGDRRGVARALIQLGELERARGDSTAAERMLATALEIGRSLGNRRQTMQALNGLGNVHFDFGRFDRAADMYEEAIRVSREIGDQRTEAVSLGNLASTRNEQGRIVEALNLDERALSIVRIMGDRRSVAFALTNMAETATVLGRLADAEKMYTESRAISETLRDDAELSYAISGQAAVALHRDDLAQARSLLEATVRLRDQLGDAKSAMEARVDLARVLIELGEMPLARHELEGLREARSAAAPDTRARAAAVEALAALIDGRVADARTELRRVLAGDQPAFALATRMMLQLTDAQIASAEGNTTAARRLAQGVAEQSRRQQLLAFELEAELALLRIERRGKQASERLAVRARQAGFLLVARKAAAG